MFYSCLPKPVSAIPTPVFDSSCRVTLEISTQKIIHLRIDTKGVPIGSHSPQVTITDKERQFPSSHAKRFFISGSSMRAENGRNLDRNSNPIPARVEFHCSFLEFSKLLDFLTKRLDGLRLWNGGQDTLALMASFLSSVR